MELKMRNLLRRSTLLLGVYLTSLAYEKLTLHFRGGLFWKRFPVRNPNYIALYWFLFQRRMWLEIFEVRRIVLSQTVACLLTLLTRHSKVERDKQGQSYPARNDQQHGTMMNVIFWLDIHKYSLTDKEKCNIQNPISCHCGLGNPSNNIPFCHA